MGRRHQPLKTWNPLKMHARTHTQKFGAMRGGMLRLSSSRSTPSLLWDPSSHMCSVWRQIDAMAEDTQESSSSSASASSSAASAPSSQTGSKADGYNWGQGAGALKSKPKRTEDRRAMMLAATERRAAQPGARAFAGCPFI